MVFVLIFAVTLLCAVLVSGLAQRSVLSTAVLFLVAGFVVGERVLGLVTLRPDAPVVSTLIELALFSVLFTEGMQLGAHDLTSAWQLPGRALLLGLPLTLGGTALLAHLLVGLPWIAALLLGAALSPTDPVLATAIVGRREVPQRLRHLLNIESGLNDGLALPVVFGMLALLGTSEVGIWTLLDLASGVALGIFVPWAAAYLERIPLFSVSPSYQPLYAVAVGLLVLSTASLTHSNEFLAAFTAGVTVATVSTELRNEFRQFGELVTELLKLLGLLIFGSFISPRFLAEISWDGYVFAFLVLIAVRPFALWLALWGSPFTRREWVAAAWFGPKGFASMFFGLLVLKAGVSDGDQLFYLIALVVAGSIVAHSSTDVIVARWVQGPQSELVSPSRHKPVESKG